MSGPGPSLHFAATQQFSRFRSNPHLRKVAYDPLAFEPVCNLVSFPLVIVVGAG
jgi:hypothetical protein